MKPALYILSGVIAVLAFIGLSLLLAKVMTDLFGTWGLLIEMVVLFSLAGGTTGWMIYREQARPLPPFPRFKQKS